MEPQEVVLGQTETSDWWFCVHASVRPVPIVHVGPDWQMGGALVGGPVCTGIGAFPEGGLDEALCFVVGSGRVGLGADVLDTQFAAGVLERAGFVAAAIIGHDALNPDAHASVPGDGRLEEGDCAHRLFVGMDPGERQPGMVVDGDMDELPARGGSVVALIALPVPACGDAVADPIESAQLFDVQMDHLAGVLSFIAAHRLGRINVFEARQTGAAEHTADSGR